jgi:hypothetical protein
MLIYVCTVVKWQQSMRVIGYILQAVPCRCSFIIANVIFLVGWFCVCVLCADALSIDRAIFQVHYSRLGMI